MVRHNFVLMKLCVAMSQDLETDTRKWAFCCWISKNGKKVIGSSQWQTRERERANERNCQVSLVVEINQQERDIEGSITNGAIRSPNRSIILVISFERMVGMNCCHFQGRQKWVGLRLRKEQTRASAVHCERKFEKREREREREKVRWRVAQQVTCSLAVFLVSTEWEWRRG